MKIRGIETDIDQKRQKNYVLKVKGQLVDDKRASSRSLRMQNIPYDGQKDL